MEITADLEHEHVHKVYSKIATHFSDTRFKPWPRIAQFLSEQPASSLIADIGEKHNNASKYDTVTVLVLITGPASARTPSFITPYSGYISWVQNFRMNYPFSINVRTAQNCDVPHPKYSQF